MRSLFQSKLKVTQAFGVNAQYYSKFGLKAHEGLDCIPTGSVWNVLCLEDGVVVKDMDDAIQGKAYGKYVTVWHPTINKATQYCHLASNIVSNGTVVKRGDVLGVMGAIGNVTGAHVPLNLFNVDDNGIRLNTNNGYLGGINPQPFLDEDIVETPLNDIEKLKAQLAQEIQNKEETYIEMTEWKDRFTRLCDRLKTAENVELALAAVDELLKHEDIVRDQQKEIALKDAQFKEVKEQVNTLDTQVKELLDANKVLTEQNQELLESVKDNQKQLDIQEKEIVKLGMEIEHLKSESPVNGYTISTLVSLLIKKILRI